MSTDVEQSLRVPTVIDVSVSSDSDSIDEEYPYYGRTQLTLHVSSTTIFDRIVMQHLGFRAYTVGKRSIHLRGDRYVGLGLLDPNGSVQVVIPPFGISAENMGDGFCRVGIRLRYGMERCKAVILQEEHQSKPPMDATFIKVEDIWYAFATINVLQTIRIEELGEPI